MEQELYKVKVPGSTMLLGEHAVLFHGQAIVCAIDQYLQVRAQVGVRTLAPKCKIIATNFGVFEVALDNIEVTAPLTFVLQALKEFSQQLQALSCNIEITIEAQFKATLGFGSSSAVTVAMVAILSQIINQRKIKPAELLRIAHKVVTKVQMVGSGADLAASIYGGVIAYNAKTYQVTRLPAIPNFYLIYAGYKTPTAVVIAAVAENFKNKASELAQIYTGITQTVLDGIQAINLKNYAALSAIFDRAFLWQQQLQVSDDQLNKIVKLAGCGSKISGSGCGDCVITFNKIDTAMYESYALAVSELGIQYV